VRERLERQTRDRVHRRARAGALVQPVDVLRDHRLHPAAVLERLERAVPLVRLRVPNTNSRRP
jgi:hypothetical protein